MLRIWMGKKRYRGAERRRNYRGVIYLKLQLEVLLLGNKTQVLRDLSGPSPLVNLYFKTK